MITVLYDNHEGQMVRAAKERPGSGISTILGDCHLKDDWNTTINRTVAELKDLGVSKVGPRHCSGEAAREKMASVYGAGYLEVALGFRLKSLETA